MKHLIIQLCDTSVSFCHYSPADEPRLITIELLKAGLVWAVKNALDVHVVFPDYVLPSNYTDLLAEFNYVSIKPEQFDDGDITVLDGWDALQSLGHRVEQPAVLRTSVSDFVEYSGVLERVLLRFSRLNVVFTDVWNFEDGNVDIYENALTTLADKIRRLYGSGNCTKLNLLTDRIALSWMNNCNAGNDTVTLAPDGNFYICPGFYFSGYANVGNPADGLSIPDGRLYRIENAPICRRCDAYHCKRCVWLNKKMTLEVNTPSHEQCVMAHVERKVSQRLLSRLRDDGIYCNGISIPELDYMDPFEKIKNL